jgi:hypothetical protein
MKQLNTKMVNGIVISANGTISDLQIPAKTSDILEWIRKKYKNTQIQFQGKIQDPVKESNWLSIFASTNGDEDQINQHMLPSPLMKNHILAKLLFLHLNLMNKMNMTLIFHLMLI